LVTDDLRPEAIGEGGGARKSMGFSGMYSGETAIKMVGYLLILLKMTN
jgi:hypothetical protein